MQNPICKYCGQQALYCFSPFPNTNWRSHVDPRFKFHIGIRCVQCDKWSGWVLQTKELMDFLAGAVLIPKDRINATAKTEN